jgi:1,4-dihydroxy-2-naphthoate octaprenyltransferase
MTNDKIVTQRSKSSLWVQAVRPFAFSASVIPVLLGAMGALLFFPGNIAWYLLPVLIVAAILFHTGGNLISEYFDYKNEVDRKETLGGGRILVDELLPPKHILNAGILSFVVGFLLGLILVWVRGLDILYLGLFGLIAGIFYTVKPFQFKYIALGDLLIFLAFGPLLVLGSYFALTGDMNWNIIWVSFPISFLVVGILHANNTRDMKFDKQAHIKTFAGIIGMKGAKAEYYFLITGAYITTVILILTGIVDWYVLLVALSLPAAIKNIKLFSNASMENPQEIAMLDVQTAQLHMQFGLLFIIGMLLSALL